MIRKRLNSQRRASKRLPATSVPALRNHWYFRIDSNHQPTAKRKIPAWAGDPAGPPFARPLASIGAAPCQRGVWRVPLDKNLLEPVPDFP